MLDLAYLAVTIGFFALMLGYVRGCELFRHEESEEEKVA